MKYLRAYKKCLDCGEVFKGYEYSLRCSECKREAQKALNVSKPTYLKYERMAWEMKKDRLTRLLISTIPNE